MMRRRIAAIVAAGALATTAIGIPIGVSSVAKASEVGYDYLCVDGATQECAYGASPIEIKPENTNWYYPVAGQIGEIRQANTDLCMQVDHDAGNIIVEATCTGASYQEWYGEPSGTEFETQWNTTDCLTYDQSGQNLDIHGCSDGSDPVWYQAFWE